MVRSCLRLTLAIIARSIEQAEALSDFFSSWRCTPLSTESSAYRCVET